MNSGNVKSALVLTASYLLGMPARSNAVCGSPDFPTPNPALGTLQHPWPPRGALSDNYTGPQRAIRQHSAYQVGRGRGSMFSARHGKLPVLKL